MGRFRLDCAVDEDRLKRHDLTDAEWVRLAPLLPRHPRQGHRWNDHRLVIDGIFHRTRTGCPWRDLPERFGNWKTVYNRHRRWSADGTWEMILDRLRAGCDQGDGAAWTVAADATVVRAHQHAAGARRQPPADVDPGRLAPAELSAPAHRRGLSRITRTGRP
jgi:transposase